MLAAAIGVVVGVIRVRERHGDKGPQTLSDGVFMGPASPTALDKMLAEQANNYTGIMGQPVTPSDQLLLEERSKESAGKLNKHEKDLHP